MARTANDIHESFAANLAYENQIFWDAYSPQQFSVFKEKLNQLLRDPEAEGSNANKPMEKIRDSIYKSTISQTKYTNKNLLATFILVTVAEGTTYKQARDARKFSVHLLIRTRKCKKNQDSTDCCMVFIDEHARVYKNWKSFMDSNLLPEGVALAPENGVYTFENEKLIMDSWVTPASGLTSKIVAGTDIAAGIGGMGAAALTISALALPVAPAALACAGVVCAGTGIYSAVRSGWQLWTRKEHEQSIALTDSSARGCWLGVATGAVAVSSSVANKALAQVARAGKEVSMIRETVVNGMNISTMLLSGTGVANGVLDLILKYSDDEKINTLDYVQVAASLVIFTHSVYNFRLASTIVSQAQDSKVNAYKTELSKNQKKMFNKITKETYRTKGATKGKTDIIRLINEAPDNQYLNDMNKVNKVLNKNNIRFAAGKDGNIVLNDEVPVKPSVLRANIQNGNGENILQKVTKPIPQSHPTIQNPEAVNTLTRNALSENSNHLISYCEEFFKLAGVLILNRDGLQNCVRYLIEHYGEPITKFLIEKARLFLEKFQRTVEDCIKTTLYYETVLWDLYKRCEEKLVTLTLEVLEDQIPKIFQALLSYYEGLSTENCNVEKILCDVCGGYYEICSII